MGVVSVLEIAATLERQEIGGTAAPEAGEDALVRRAASGDVGAFEALHRLHGGRIHALCRRLLGDGVQAEDCVQEAFVKAWRSLASFDGRARFSTWLHQIAVRVALDEKRRQSRRPHLTAMAVAEPGGERRSDDLRVELERALARLPETARHVVVLHDVYGYEHAEIAKMTGSTEGGSRSQLHRARVLLRKALAPGRTA
jgi:RNA polymerase sigma-70 factor (ECF subfamily)